MKYQIVGKNVENKDENINVGVKKLTRMNKYFVINDDVTCRAVVSAYRNSTVKVEVMIFTHMMDFRAEVSAATIYDAADDAIDKLERQMRKLKTRLDRSHKQSLAESIALENFESTAEENAGGEVVRMKEIYLEPMQLEEAILRMEALSHDFFLYLDEEDNRISVVYCRKDGGYGIIQAENKVK